MHNNCNDYRVNVSLMMYYVVSSWFCFVFYLKYKVYSYSYSYSLTIEYTPVIPYNYYKLWNILCLLLSFGIDRIPV